MKHAQIRINSKKHIEEIKIILTWVFFSKIYPCGLIFGGVYIWGLIFGMLIGLHIWGAYIHGGLYTGGTVLTRIS